MAYTRCFWWGSISVSAVVTLKLGFFPVNDVLTRSKFSALESAIGVHATKVSICSTRQIIITIYLF